MIEERPEEELTWAEGEPPDIENTNPPTEPSLERKESGYGYNEPITHEIFNWLFRAVCRWVLWLESKADNHVHDGGDDPESVPKVDAQDHVDWNGVDLDINTTSAGSSFTWVYATGPVSSSKDIYIARDHMVTDEIQPDESDAVEINDLKAENLETETVSAIGDEITVEDDTTFENRADASHTARLWAHIRPDREDPPDQYLIESGSGVDSNIYEKLADGEYAIFIDQDLDHLQSDGDVGVHATINEERPELTIKAFHHSGNEIRIYIYESVLEGAPEEGYELVHTDGTADFTVSAYWE